MRDIKRIKPFLDRLQKLWEKEPDLRLGQIIGNIFSQNPTWLYYIEDDELINTLEEFYKQINKKK